MQFLGVIVKPREDSAVYTRERPRDMSGASKQEIQEAQQDKCQANTKGKGGIRYMKLII